MRFLKGLNSKKKGKEDLYDADRQGQPYVSRPPATDLTAKLPAPLIEKIFAAVCPHAQDASYESCEQSAVDDACMLCDLRDLAHCAAVSRRWRKLAANVLYYSIRIDPVHYCEREEILAEKRKRRSFFDRNADPEDTPQQRLRLLCRTLREDNSGLAQIVRFLKITYMTRETCKADLARTISILPKLRYVDLPEGFYTDDSTCNTLKQELQARCPDIRKMSYLTGSERSLELLGRGAIWRNLEVLELRKLNTDPITLRHVFGALASLRAIKLADMEFLDDNFFQYSPNLPPFPALTELLFEQTPNVTTQGLVYYLSNPQTASSLLALSFNETGVHPSTLQPILAAAQNLQHLSIIEQVSTSFPANSPTPPLSSQSLLTLHYEITPTTSNKSSTSATASYYAYLTSSLLAHGLPNLRQVYVRDRDFPDSLLDFTAPMPAFAAGSSPSLKAPPPPYPRSPNLSPNPNSYLRPDSVFSDYDSPPSGFSSNNPFSPVPTSPGRVQTPMTVSTTGGSTRTNGTGNSYTSKNGHNRKPIPRPQELEVYTKGPEEMEWNFARVDHRASSQPQGFGARRGSHSSTTPSSLNIRPVSMYGLAASGMAGAGQLSPTWSSAGFGGNDVRKSTVVQSEAGGFLAVPGSGMDHFPRPGSSGGFSSGGNEGVSEWPGAGAKQEKRSSRYDIWR